MNRTIVRSFYKAFAGPIAALVAAHAIGTLGFRIIGGPHYSLLDCLYMTFITIATIGFSEVVDVSSPAGRIFTMAIGASGIAIVYYMLAKMTMFLVADEVNVVLRRRRMQKSIDSLSGHYILCGIGRVGSNVAHELSSTKRPYVVIDTNQPNLDAHAERYGSSVPRLHGDASEDQILLDAGLMRAAGVFAVSGDDAKNLVICLSAKQLNPGIRVVARCHDVNYIEKIRRVGADDIVSPDFTGGMRIASSMIRPHVVNFLDEMLRSDAQLRVEEIGVPKGFHGANLGSLGLRGRDYVLVAVRAGSQWLFNPQDELRIEGGNSLIVMTTPEGRMAIERRLSA